MSEKAAGDPIVPDFTGMRAIDAQVLAFHLDFGWLLDHRADGDLPITKWDARILRNCSHNPPRSTKPSGADLGVELDVRIEWARIVQSLVTGLIGGLGGVWLAHAFQII